MKIFNNINDWRQARQSFCSHSSLGFVPTMGNLHKGHASLFAASRKDNDLTAVSLFVNPTQFNHAEDFALYPRTLDADLDLLEKAGVDYCILPDEKALYADSYCYQIQENKLSLLMEGKHRPGHFTGVLTVVMKLLNLVRPRRAYFGEKDYQQLQLIRDMVSSFFMEVEIISCPTIREDSGLAYSSRNNRLTPEERHLAEKFAQVFLQNYPQKETIERLNKLGVTVEYIEEYHNRRYAAVKVGNIRLIDNYSLL